MKNIRIGDLLVMEGLITQEQLEEAIAAQKASTAKKRLGEIIIEQKLITEYEMLNILSKQFGAKLVRLDEQPVAIASVAKIPKQMALKYNLIAISETDGMLNLVMSDPLDFYALEDVKLTVNMPVSILLCQKLDIQKAIHYWYAELDARNAAQSANLAVAGAETVAVEDLSGAPGDTPVVALVNSVLYKAHNAGASDIHIEPFEENTIVRIRVDGQILEFLTLSKALHNSVITRLKILSSLDIAEKRIPQDGHFRARQNGVEINVRVSILPSIYGEKAVLRFLSRDMQIDHSQTFGMEEGNYRRVRNILNRPHGILYITGPTGCGKTTTLYMILEELSKNPVNISTIEDPVERNLPKITQTQTNPQAGLTFQTGLRSLLRQDPDIIMVGETRDSETASIAVSAALTGHVVLSTLHTNDAVSAIVRLTDMGIEPYMIANSLTGVVAQRLAKKICPACRTAYTPSDAELAVLGEPVEVLYRGAGCPACNQTGYKGRIAIHEVLTIDGPLRGIISRKETVETIYEYLGKNNLLTTLRDSMKKIVLEGVSTTEEMLKIISFL